MNTLSQIPLRIEINALSNPPNDPIDSNTGNAPRLWRGGDVMLQFAIFNALQQAVDLSNLTSFQVIIQANQQSLFPLISKTINAGSITASVNRADWLAGIAQQVQVPLTAADTDQGLGAQPSATFWMIVQGFSNTGQQLVYGAGQITIYNPGSTLTPSGNYVSENPQALVSPSNITCQPTTQIHTEVVSVGGVAGTCNVILPQTAGLVPGSQLGVLLLLPATAGIVINIRNGTLAGTILNVLNTAADGSLPTAFLQYYLDNNLNWQKRFTKVPAY